MAAYKSLLPEVRDAAPGCLDTVALRAIRDTVIDLCKEAHVWQYDLSGTLSFFFPNNQTGVLGGEYPEGSDEPFLRLPLPNVGSTPENTLPGLVSRLFWFVLEGIEYFPTPTRGVDRYSTRGVPTRPSPDFTFSFDPPDTDNGAILVFPHPGGANPANWEFETRLVLKPKIEHMEILNGNILEEYHEAILDGAIWRLLRRPNKPWTDLRGSLVFRDSYMDALDKAQHRASGATGSAPIVEYGGLGVSEALGPFGENSYYRTRRVLRS